jgi:hypothetical protein
MPVDAPSKPKSQMPVYSMPTVEIGDIVIVRYRPDDARCHPCLVMATGKRSLDLFHLGAFRSMNGIRHKSDPDLRERPELIQDTGGCWEESSTPKRIRVLEGVIADLGQRLTDLEKPRS